MTQPTRSDKENLQEVVDDSVTAVKVSRLMIHVIGIGLLLYFISWPLLNAVGCVAVWLLGTGAATKIAEILHLKAGQRALAKENLRQMKTKAGPE